MVVNGPIDKWTHENKTMPQMNNKTAFTETHHELNISFEKNVSALSTTCSN